MFAKLFKKKKKEIPEAPISEPFIPEFLKSLGEQLKLIHINHPSINSGGCAFFASALRKKLEEFGMKADYYVISNENLPSIVKHRTDNSLHAINKIGVMMYHVMCKVDNFIMDSTGVYVDQLSTKWNQTHMKGEVMTDYHVLESWLHEEGVWNPAFNMEELPDIYARIEEISLN